MATQYSRAGHNLVASWPQKGHNGAMQRPAKTKAGQATKPDAYKDKRHKFYADEWVAEGLDELARYNKAAGKAGTTRSELIINFARKELRKHAAELRARGVSLPDDLFVK